MIPLNLFPYLPMSGHVAVEKQGLGNWMTLIYEPGDGIKYTLLLLGPIPDAVECGNLGAIDPGGYLVVSGDNGRAMLIQRSGVLTATYVAEKLVCTPAWAEAIATMLQAATGRESYGFKGGRLETAAEVKAKATPQVGGPP